MHQTASPGSVQAHRSHPPHNESKFSTRIHTQKLSEPAAASQFQSAFKIKTTTVVVLLRGALVLRNGLCMSSKTCNPMPRVMFNGAGKALAWVLHWCAKGVYHQAQSVKGWHAKQRALYQHDGDQVPVFWRRPWCIQEIWHVPRCYLLQYSWQQFYRVLAFLFLWRPGIIGSTRGSVSSLVDWWLTQIMSAPGVAARLGLQQHTSDSKLISMAPCIMWRPLSATRVAFCVPVGLWQRHCWQMLCGLGKVQETLACSHHHPPLA